MAFPRRLKIDMGIMGTLIIGSLVIPRPHGFWFTSAIYGWIILMIYDGRNMIRRHRWIMAQMDRYCAVLQRIRDSKLGTRGSLVFSLTYHLSRKNHELLCYHSRLVQMSLPERCWHWIRGGPIP